MTATLTPDAITKLAAARAALAAIGITEQELRAMGVAEELVADANDADNWLNTPTLDEVCEARQEGSWDQVRDELCEATQYVAGLVV